MTAALVIASAGGNPLPATAAETAGTNASGLEEIIVTARKRQEEIQDVPISVFAISGQTLAERGLTDAVSLASNVAGIAVQDGGPGYRTIFIRGMGSDRGNAPTTSFYLDESFVPPGGIVQTIIEPLYFDVDHVEVLRGPQGTVFGGSSMGGTVRVISNSPDTREFDAAAGADLSQTQDGGTNYQVSGMVNMVLAPEKIALRVAGSYRQRDGFLDQIVAPGGFTGPKRTPVGATEHYDNFNDDEALTLRAALSLDLTENLNITPSIFYQRTEAGAFAAMDRPTEKRDIRRVVRADEGILDEITLGNLLVTYDFGPVELLSSTSWSQRPASYREDITDFVFTKYFGGLMATRVQSPYDAESDEDLFTQELRLASTGDSRFSYVAGAYLENYKRGSDAIVAIPPDDLVAAFLPAWQPIAASLFPTGVIFERKSRFERKQYAVFGEAGYDLTSKWNLAAGLRYYKYKMDSEVILPSYQSVENDEQGVNPRVTLSYKASDDRMVYATTAKGFRPGGPNRVFDARERAACTAQYEAAGVNIDPVTGLVEPYKGDSVWNYEIGAKTDWLGGRLRVNTAAYYMDWQDIQQTFLPACGRAVTQNFGSAEVKGVELEWTAQLSDSLSFFGGLNYNDAAIAEDIPDLGVSEGTKVQNSPEWSGNANVQYDFNGPLATDASLVFNVRYVGSSYRDFAQTEASSRRFQDEYTQLNLRLNVVRGNWTWFVYGTNLTDESPGVMNFLSSGGPIDEYERMFTLQPRTFGVGLRVDH